MALFICYERCSTCKKAQKFLDDNGISYEMRPIKEQNPTAEEIKAWSEAGSLPLKKFFNTSGQLYRAMELSKKLPEMSEQEQLEVLASDGMLVKRPLFIDGDIVLTGFKQAEWEQKLLK